MRLPKFRCKNKIGNWCFFTVLHNGNVNEENFDLETLSQFTGLLDKQGLEIYEGDIVIHKGEYLSLKKPAFVIFENGRFVMDCGDSVTHRLYKWSDNWSIEVIGNIYENKELLEEIK